MIFFNPFWQTSGQSLLIDHDNLITNSYLPTIRDSSHISFDTVYFLQLKQRRYIIKNQYIGIITVKQTSVSSKLRFCERLSVFDGLQNIYNLNEYDK
jgi:hypothetical protein